MVRIHPDPPEQGSGAPVADDRGRGRKQDGAVAQLGEHLLCKQGVVGSIPISSTSTQAPAVPIGCSAGQRSTLAIGVSRQR